MEFLAELILMLLQAAVEFVIQLVFEALARFGIRCLREPFRVPEPVNPFLAAAGYALLGAAAGGLSLLVFPTLFIESEAARVVNLYATPVALGFVMWAFGAWRERRGETPFRFDRFSYGFVFAFAMALVRFYYGATPAIMNVAVL